MSNIDQPTNRVTHYVSKDIQVLDTVSAIRKRPGMYLSPHKKHPEAPPRVYSMLWDVIDFFLQHGSKRILINLGLLNNTVEVSGYTQSTELLTVVRSVEHVPMGTVKPRFDIADREIPEYTIRGSVGLVVANCLCSIFNIDLENEFSRLPLEYREGRIQHYLFSKEDSNKSVIDFTYAKIYMKPDETIFKDMDRECVEITDSTYISNYLEAHLPKTCGYQIMTWI